MSLTLAGPGSKGGHAPQTSDDFFCSAKTFSTNWPTFQVVLMQKRFQFHRGDRHPYSLTRSSAVCPRPRAHQILTVDLLVEFDCTSAVDYLEILISQNDLLCVERATSNCAHSFTRQPRGMPGDPSISTSSPHQILATPLTPSS